MGFGRAVLAELFMEVAVAGKSIQKGLERAPPRRPRTLGNRIVCCELDQLEYLMSDGLRATVGILEPPFCRREAAG